MPSGGILRIRNLNWNFDNSFAEQLEGFYAPVKTEAPPAPELLLFNPDLAQQLALPVAETEESELAAILGGGQIPKVRSLLHLPIPAISSASIRRNWAMVARLCLAKSSRLMAIVLICNSRAPDARLSLAEAMASCCLARHCANT